MVAMQGIRLIEGGSSSSRSRKEVRQRRWRKRTLGVTWQRGNGSFQRQVNHIPFIQLTKRRKKLWVREKYTGSERICAVEWSGCVGEIRNCPKTVYRRKLDEDTIKPNLFFGNIDEYTPKYIAKEAFDIEWNHTTVRGWPDGSTVFKFGVVDPPDGEEVSFKDQFPDDVCWRNSLRLGIKFAHQARNSLAKLDHYIFLYRSDRSIHPRMELRHSMYKTYMRALQRLEKRGLDVDSRKNVHESREVPNFSMAMQNLYDRVDIDCLAKKVKNNILVRDHRRDSNDPSGKLGWRIPGKGSIKTINRSKKDTPRDDHFEDIKRNITKSSLFDLIEMESVHAIKGSISEETGHWDKTDTDQHLVLSKEKLIKEYSFGEQNVSEAVDTVARNAIWRIKTSLILLLHALSSRILLLALQFAKAVRTVLFSPLFFYRLLPYSIRCFLQIPKRSWPPKLNTIHSSKKISEILKKKETMSRDSLARIGFDPQGRTLKPLSDVRRWQLEGLLGCGIRNTALYRTALTHPTALPPELRSKSYERLEYLGDAVMELCIREFLMEQSPEADEGELTSQSQVLVNGSNVSKYGEWLGLDRWILKNAYSMRDSNVVSPYILGDVFESLLGALYIDQGLESARKWLIRVITECPAVDLTELSSPDYKGTLTRFAQLRKKDMPQYQVIEVNRKTFGDDGIKRRCWTVQVLFDGEILGQGTGFEKRSAEQEAARDALLAIEEVEESSDPDGKAD